MPGRGKWTRRQFVAISAAAGAAFGAGVPAAAQETPWHQKVRRWGQLNFNERDAGDLNVDEWMDYWASLRVDGVTMNAGGIVAMYPTRVPYHHRSEFLGNRDVFGELAAACKIRKLRLIARLDPNYAYEDCLKAHPDWFERTRDGKPQTHNESTWLYRTCMFGPHYSQQMPAIIREINSRYDVDGFYTNGWPGTAIAAPCFCPRCEETFRAAYGKDLPREARPSDPAYQNYVEFHRHRVLEVWKLWDGTAKEKKPDSVYIGNLGGSVRATLNLKAVCGGASWYNADHQGRSGNTPLWDCAQQGRAARAAIGGRTATNVTGAYANAQPLWRHTAKAPAEARLWLAQTAASGMVPWWVWLGAHPDDRRWMDVGREFYQWHARHSEHFENRRSLAEVAVVWSQTTAAFYRERAQVHDYLQGFYFALLQGRIPFDLVHEDDLDAERLKPYRLLILPNVALLSDRQCAQLKAFADQGGSLLATFETSRYDEWGAPRKNLGLAGVFGIAPGGGVQGPLVNSYARVEKAHPLLDGLPSKGLLPGAEYRVPVTSASSASPVLTYVPPYPAFPPEMVYPRTEKTNEPAVLLAERGSSRVVYFPGDVDRSFWRSGNQDLSRLLQNAVRWAAGALAPVEIEGPGLADVFFWETARGLALHLVNYNNPALMKTPVVEFFPIGPLRINMKLPPGFRAREVRLLAGDVAVPHRIESGRLRFEIPTIKDYEIAAILS